MTLATAAGLFGLADAGAIPTMVPKTLHDMRITSAGPVEPGFAIDVVGAVWEGNEPGDAGRGEVRFRHGGSWSDWRAFGEDGAQADGRFATNLVSGNDADAYQLRGVPAWTRAVALNTTDGPLIEVGRRRRTAASAATVCRSRADWGADESIKKGTPPTYATPLVLTIHHTADDAGDPSTTRDPAARIRAIYAYHVGAQGFDDIGYQYLIDEAGIVYEGRASGTASKSCLTEGGTGDDFGHEEAPADRAVVGAHVTRQNTGNIGTALLGNFEAAVPPAAQRTGLEHLLADLSRRHNIDPTDTQYTFVNASSGETRTIPRISGHRDWLATLCPGGMLYGALPSIRTNVAALVAAGPTPTSTTSTSTSTTAAPSTTTTPSPPPPPPPPRSGYWMVGADGSVFAFGDARNLGGAPFTSAADLEATPSGAGYWIVDSLGNVADFGDARTSNRPSLGLRAGERVSSLSAAGVDRGYWLFTTAGRVIPVDGAPFFGDMSGVQLNGPVLDSIPTPSGRGYYLVASDGGIFTFGDAAFAGSMGGVPLTAPVQSLVPDGDGGGYWLVASDGGIFAFDAPFYGSMGDQRLNRPITGMVADGSAGYLMVAEDGGIFAFGSARFHGSLGDRALATTIVAAATTPP